MYTGVSRRLCQIRRQLHTISSSHEGPSETLKRKIAGLQWTRKSKKLKIKKDQFIVEVPESKSYLDTASLPMILTVVGVGLFAKLLMMVLSSLLFTSILFSITFHFPRHLFFFFLYIKLIKYCFLLIFILILMMDIFVETFLNVGTFFFVYKKGALHRLEKSEFCCEDFILFFSFFHNPHYSFFFFLLSIWTN